MTESVSSRLAIAALKPMQKKRTPLGDAWYQLTRNRMAVISLLFIVFLLVVALSADLLRNAGFIEGIDDQHRGSSMAPPLTCATLQLDQTPYPAGAPQFCFVFGADQLGRDVLSRTVYGTRVSLSVAVVGAVISLSVGVLYGIVSGYYGGKVDNVMMRILDFLYGVPSLVLVILFQTFFTALERSPDPGAGKVFIDIDRSMGGLFFLFIALGALSWISMARLARGEILSYKAREFVEAARAMGASDRRIIFLHLLPNILGPLIVAETLEIPGYIFTEAFLSFIGLGVQPPTPSLGFMVAEGRQWMELAPWVVADWRKHA